MIEITQQFGFDAAHYLEGAPSDANRRLHGHSFYAEVSLRGETDTAKGWVRDFGEVNAVLGAIREGDFTLRARGASYDDSLGELMMEINALSDALQHERLGALEAGVGAELREQTRVVVPQRTEVKLLRPAPRGVPPAELEHEVGAVTHGLLRCRRATAADRIKHHLGLCMRARLRERVLQTMVRQAAPGGVEIIVALLQRAEQVVEGLDAVRMGRATDRQKARR